MSDRVVVPPGLAEQRELGEPWASWLDRLPGLVAGLVGEWALTPDGEPLHGATALVLPVRDDSGRRRALKVGLIDEESAGEIPALQLWGGRGAARLVRADPRRGALLLEWLGPDDLTVTPDDDACRAVAGLYADLHRPAAPQLKPVYPLVRRWLDDLESVAADRRGRALALPRRFVDQALRAGRRLASGPATHVIHGDLHYGNVLARPDGSWAAIDPKGFNGDPGYELAPMLWNRWDDLAETGDVGNAVRRRFFTLVDTAGLDEPRCRDWVIVRSMVNCSWQVLDARRAGRPLAEDERAWVTRCITTAKAMQDVGAGDLG